MKNYRLRLAPSRPKQSEKFNAVLRKATSPIGLSLAIMFCNQSECGEYNEVRQVNVNRADAEGNFKVLQPQPHVQSGGGRNDHYFLSTSVIKPVELCDTRLYAVC